MTAETVAIVALGAQGDGVAQTETGAVHVPFTLPGETAIIARQKARGTLIAVKKAAPERVSPPCPHFGPDGKGGACGGCNLQHLALPGYESWKRGLVARALEGQGLEAEVKPLHACPTGARRRMALTARRTGNGIVLGFNRAGSHHIVAMETCLVGDPRIAGSLGTLRRVAAAVCASGKSFRLTVLASETGLDVAVEGAGRLSDRQRLAAVETVLAEPSIARVALDGEVLVETRRPVVTFGAASVTPPPGGFVQASAAAEEYMAGLVTTHLSGCRRVADLFAGSGTFALRLARTTTVLAAESDAGALAALDEAFRHSAGTRQVKTERRDLFRRPMMAAELKSFDGVVFDPPRAGAETQSRELARSAVKRIAAVSCNPASLARDLRILVDAGFRIVSVHPVDQFLWSPHVEAVALLARD